MFRRNVSTLASKLKTKGSTKASKRIAMKREFGGRSKGVEMKLLSYKPPVPALLAEKKDFSKTKLKIGDLVEVICPEFFSRVGYPLSLEEAQDIVEKAYCEQIKKLLRDTHLYGVKATCKGRGIGIRSFFQTEQWPPMGGKRLSAYREIVRGLALMYLEREGYGGTTRSIHTKRDNRFMGWKFAVAGLRRVKTGTYDPPYCYQDDYSGEWDSYSGGLHNCQTHTIVQLAYPAQDEVTYYDAQLSIERCNVRKVETLASP